MLSGSKVMAGVDETGVMFKNLAGLAREMVKVSMSPARILIFPVTLIPKRLSLKSGHSMLLLRLSALMALSLKSRMEMVKTGRTSQLRDTFGFLNSNFIVMEEKKTSSVTLNLTIMLPLMSSGLSE